MLLRKVLIGQTDGLPNITGTFTQGKGLRDSSASGAFARQTGGEAWVSEASSSLKDTNRGWNFDASRSNSIYGNI